MRGIDRWFERWCRRGDARALERLFDATAPRLLRLGVHLTGDAAEAEDLVQAVFVALIEGREHVDAERPAWPWLASVLARRAVDAKRRAGRASERAAAVERVVEDASRDAERREFAAELARALDAIDEPYRQPLVLALRHGLSPAEIAHALGRSPGTVRVQLHRGREQLRVLLPASLAGALALLVSAPRGLAVVRAAVLREAAASAALATSAALPTGVLLMRQKSLAALAACAALAAVVWFAKAPSSAPLAKAPVAEIENDASSEPAESRAAELAREVGAETDETASERRSVARALRGRVFDAETQEPLAGAQVALFAPQERVPLDALRAQPELFESHADGSVHSRYHSDWPYLEDVSELARLGRETARIYAPPAPGAEPIARATSDAEGRFELPAEAGGVLRCELEPYATRMRAAWDLEREWEVALRRERRLAGVVVTADGDAPPPLRLGFGARSNPDLTNLTRMPSDACFESLGTWAIDCDAAGRFELTVAAEVLDVSVLTPGWAVADRSQAINVREDARLVVEPVPSLRAYDAASGIPIERLHLAGRDGASGYVIWSGVFDAPGGLLELPPGPWLDRAWIRNGASLAVWADGYAETRLSIPSFEVQRAREVPLERGTLSSVEGVVTRGGVPVRGAKVALLGHSPTHWDAEEDHVVEATLTDAAGGFHVDAPAGRYLLRVRDEGGTYFELVELPREDPLAIDLERGGRIDVFVADEAGEPRAGHTVAVNGADGRGESAETGADGRASFADLAPQRYIVFTTFKTGLQSFGADLREDVELARGEGREVRFELPRQEGRKRIRVHAAGELSYEGWMARADSGDWERLEADGTLAQGVAELQYTVEVRAKDGRLWTFDAPRGARDGDVVELCAGSARIAGAWLDETGKPLEGWRVYALPLGSEPDSSPRVRASVLTDERGAFELTGIAPSRHGLLFRESSRPYDYSLDGVYFVPDEPAGGAPRLVLHRPRALDPIELRGRVLSRADRAPRTDWIVTAVGRLAVEGGAFELRAENGGLAYTDAHGFFALRAVDAPSLAIAVYRAWERGGLVLETKLEPPFADPLELLVP